MVFLLISNKNIIIHTNHAQEVKVYYKRPGRQMNYYATLYRARARAKTPAIPATPMAMPPVGAGAPPVDCEEEGEDDVELETELVEELGLEIELDSEAVVESVATVEAEVVTAALEVWREGVVEPVSMALLSAVSL